ncbi:U3 small nucleolar RNA-associated protein 25 homolog isoform X1 [Periplaneta americana]|uniref:U3 small nucleolar RNA-associated protein 25 homolog isoform X1 n=1 Tax=Periplaneta americana TaxID=6978 RepID=UPI0037E7D993
MARGKGKRSKLNLKHKISKKMKICPNKKRNSKSSLKRNHVEGHAGSHSGESVDKTGFKRRKMTKDHIKSEDNFEDFSEEEQDIYKKLINTFSSRDSENHSKAIESDISTDEDTEDEKNSKIDTVQYEENELDNDNSENENEFLVGIQDDEVDNECDPFVRHFQFDFDDDLFESLTAKPNAERKKLEWPVLGQLTVTLPRVVESQQSEPIPKVTIEDKKQFAKPGTYPQRIINFDSSTLYIKTQIQNNISKANFTNMCNADDNIVPLTPLQMELFSVVNNYQDLYYPDRTLKNGEEIRFLYCLHAVNHILKTRTKIVHHNQKLLNKDDVPEEYRDQGLVRPKVVILVPFRESALRVVKMIMNIVLPDEKANIMNKKRFFEEFTGGEIVMPKKNRRPEDYEEMFTGNTDDTFRIGLTVTKKSLRLYADFYSADIIVASPLGLRVIVGAEGEEGRDFDFLASVELLVMDQADIFLMQNWDHVLHVLDHFHLQPQESHGTNFARVRSWVLNGWTQYYRQTLLFSSVILPEFNALFNKKCHNYAGKICVVNPIMTGSICHVVVQLPQVFHRFDVQSIGESVDARFDIFTKKILPQYKDVLMNHVLIYIPSYFDYVRLRNYFKKEGLNFVQICEYSKEGKIARARDMFFHDEVHFLLYSERFHFFRRPSIKGILHILFYKPPTFPHFYSEMCNLIRVTNQNQQSGVESNTTVTVLYSKYDVQQVAAIVGTDRAARMVNSERNVHMFMTGE